LFTLLLTIAVSPPAPDKPASFLKGDTMETLPWQNFGLAGLMLAACMYFIWRITGAYREDMAKARQDFQVEMQTQRVNDSAERKEDRETFGATLDSVLAKVDAIQETYKGEVHSERTTCERRHAELVKEQQETRNIMKNQHQDILLRTGLKTMLPKQEG
jgi:ABC-type nickel/cobalt efflux system permease component RcnA